MKRGTLYGYSCWSTGKTWACHAWAPHTWARQYGFETQKDAAWWGMDQIVGFKQTDAAA